MSTNKKKNKKRGRNEEQDEKEAVRCVGLSSRGDTDELGKGYELGCKSVKPEATLW